MRRLHGKGKTSTEIAKAASINGGSVYRVIQEALTNIGKHAQASTASVVVRHEDARLGIMIEDDGVGFDPEDTDGAGMGLFGIRERVEMLGGSFEIETGTGKGTVLTVRLPLANEAQDQD